MTEEQDFLLPANLRLRAPSKKHSGFWVGGMTVLVAAACFFCELHLSAAPIEQTAMTACVMLLCCFVMYTSLYDAGHARASEDPAYREVCDRYEALRERVRAMGDPVGIERFCSRYVSEELLEARTRLLLYAGVTYDTFVSWQDGELGEEAFKKLPSHKRKALVHAAALRPLRLTAALLLNEGNQGRRQLLVSVKGLRRKRTAIAMGPTLVGCLMTVGVSVEGVTLTLALVALGLLRLFSIVWTGVRGYSAGYYAVREDDTVALEGKITLLTAYCRWAGDEKTAA